jgi:hypothetical protein
VPPDARQAAARYRRDEEDSEEARRWLDGIKDDDAKQAELDDFLNQVLPERDGVSLPIVLWSRLFADLRPYLSERSAEGGTLIAFYHRELDEVADAAYLGGDEKRECHHRLADYFRRQADPDGDRSWTGSSVRGLSELPYHLAESADAEDEDDERWQELHDTLTDFVFLERKATDVGAVTTGSGEDQTTTHTGVFQLQDDFALALDRMPGDGAGGSGDRRRIIVTGTDLGDGLKIRCPHCNEFFDWDEGWRGNEEDCPGCGGPWKVNDFVVERPPA